ncbi:hypothetical protein [Actinacidiphila glaucinigra]|uniref:hypothetical protein n=1 Tax=Actinacidiphila glaucinigra TaxID=235986 RepID=UPI003D8CB8B8
MEAGLGVRFAAGDAGVEREGDGLAADGAAVASAFSGTSRATGGVGRVEPTTKPTVSMTAVTLTAVHESHMTP